MSTNQSATTNSSSTSDSGGKKTNLLGAPITPRKVKSRSSMGSRNSVDSIGMAPNIPSKQASASRLMPLSTTYEYKVRFRLLPEGTGDNDFNVFERNIYDCMVFLIYCEHHDRIVLTNVNDKNRMYSWFPFVLVHEAFTWSKTVDDGVAIILGKTDAEMDQTMAVSLPKYEAHFMGLHRTQCPKTKKYHQRMAVFVHIKENQDSRGPSDFRCCQDTAKIRWLPYRDLVARKIPNELAWGDEVIHLARQLRSEDRYFVTELIAERALTNANNDEAALLKTAKFSPSKILELYTEYLHHLYPAFLMTIHSFRCFLLKNPILPPEDARIDRIFAACVSEGRRYCNFRQFLLAIVSMEPNVPTTKNRLRIRCLFRYYDTSNKGVLVPEVIGQLLADLQRASGKNAPALTSKEIFGAGNKVTFEVFETAVNANKMPNIDLLLRSKRSYLEAKNSSSNNDFRSADWMKWVGDNNRSFKSSGTVPTPIVATSSEKKSESISLEMSKSKATVTRSGKSKSTAAASASSNQSKALRNDHNRTLCPKHSQQKKFEYGVHTVSIDTSSRCTDPRIITENWINNWGPTELTLTRFSVEHLFRINAVHNIFLDLVRAFHRKSHAPVNSKISAKNEKETRGLLCAKDDWSIMFFYFDVLCKQLLNILRAEPKLLRLNSPAIVIGDLLGSLADILAIEKALYPSVPIIPGILVFLGNYTWSDPSVETIIYIFSLKAQNPNKVYLLRGRNEMRTFNRKRLNRELRDKYGDQYGGKMWTLINAVFDALPIAATIDDAILCSHSGIPRLEKHETLVDVFLKTYAGPGFESVKQVEKQMPIGYELITNVPVNYAPNKEVLAKANKKTGFLLSKTKKYHYFDGKAFIRFLQENRLEYLIRSHNPSDEGFAHCYSCRCLTIFSNSLNSGAASVRFIAVALVNDQPRKIRVLRFKTEEIGRQGSGIEAGCAREGSKIRPMETRISNVDSVTS